MDTRGNRKGTALLWTLMMLMVISALGTAVMVATSDMTRRTNMYVDTALNLLEAEGAAEDLRAFMIRDFKKQQGEGVTPEEWAEEVKGWSLSGYHSRFSEFQPVDSSAYVRITEVSPPGSDIWIEVEAKYPVDAQNNEITDRNPQIVRQRLAFGPGPGAGNPDALLSFALLTDTVNCMFCHIQIDGDVGALKFFRPGWGNEGASGIGSGDDSRISGRVYAAMDITRDSTDIDLRDGGIKELERDPQEINLTEVMPNGREYWNYTVEDGITTEMEKKSQEELTETKDLVEDNYKGDKLPKDVTGDGVPDFPTIDPAAAINRAEGTITGGEVMKKVEIGGHYSDPGAVSDIEKIESIPKTGGQDPSSIQANVILVGTKDKPLEINGDILIQGDVIIKGYVKGTGAIYSTRNIYIPGDIFYVDSPNPYNPDSGGQRDPVANAVAAIEDGKDELRLAARQNVIIGDYTDRALPDYNTWKAAAGNLPIDPDTGQEDCVKNLKSPVSKRQPEDFMGNQFALTGTTRYTKEGNVELLYNAAAGTWNDDLGQAHPVENTYVANKYEGSIKPSVITGDNEVKQWISDFQYKQVMGVHQEQEEHGNQKNGIRDDTWRGTISGDRAQCKEQLMDNGFTDAQAETLLNSGTGWKDAQSAYISGDNSGTSRNFTIRAVWDENLMTGNAGIQDYFNQFAVMMGAADADGDGVPDDAYNYENATSRIPTVKQVENVDAYLYANRRVGGKISGTNLNIFGGMAAREVGVLVPGKNKEWWMQNSRYNWLGNLGDNPNNHMKYGYMGINYDYRLNEKNGKGLDLLTGINYGRVISWVAGRKSQTQ